MAGSVFYGRALYYPYTTFSDSKWLKTAALYYDGLDRIVPSQYHYIPDSEIVWRLNESEEFVREISPENEADTITESFLHFIETELLNSADRRRFISNLEIAIPQEVPFSIHTGKLSPVLWDILPKMGLAKSRNETRINTDAYFEFEPVTGAMYMTFLANAIAQKYNLPLITDDPVFQPLIKWAQTDKFSGEFDTGQILASMVINTVIPEDIENISVDKILAFRKYHRDERLLFYNEINRLVDDLTKVDNKTALMDCLEFRKKGIMIAVNNLEKSFKGMKIATATAMLGLSIPSFASGLGAEIAVAGVVTVATGKLLTHALDYNKSKNESPYSYVLALKNKLNAQSFAEQLWRGKLII